MKRKYLKQRGQYGKSKSKLRPQELEPTREARRMATIHSLPDIELAILRDKELTKDAKQNLYRLMVTAYKEIVDV